MKNEIYWSTGASLEGFDTILSLITRKLFHAGCDEALHEIWLFVSQHENVAIPKTRSALQLFHFLWNQLTEDQQALLSDHGDNLPKDFINYGEYCVLRDFVVDFFMDYPNHFSHFEELKMPYQYTQFAKRIDILISKLGASVSKTQDDGEHVCSIMTKLAKGRHYGK